MCDHPASIKRDDPVSNMCSHPISNECKFSHRGPQNTVLEVGENLFNRQPNSFSLSLSLTHTHTRIRTHAHTHTLSLSGYIPLYAAEAWEEWTRLFFQQEESLTICMCLFASSLTGEWNNTRGWRFQQSCGLHNMVYFCVQFTNKQKSLFIIHAVAVYVHVVMDGNRLGVGPGDGDLEHKHNKGGI